MERDPLEKDVAEIEKRYRGVSGTAASRECESARGSFTSVIVSLPAKRL
jgi:hypothetical protein